MLQRILRSLGMGNETGTGKYVVLHSLIGGGHTRGQVVSGEQLEGNAQRFLDLKAIRPATPAEAVCETVDIETQRPNLSAQQQISDKDVEIRRLQARVDEQNAQLAEHQAPKAPSKADGKQLADKDAKIAELQERIETMHAEFQAASAPHMTAKEQKKADAADARADAKAHPGK